MGLLQFIKGPRKGPSGFGVCTAADKVAAGWDGTGQNVIITGGNTGLGKETAKVLAARGANITLAVRDLKRGEQAAAEVRAAAGPAVAASVHVMALDLSSLASVKAFAEAYGRLGKPLHILINNAGVMACPFTRSADGFELQMATNHLGHFLLTNLLMPQLRAGARSPVGHGRVVNVSSYAHTFSHAGGIEAAHFTEEAGYGRWKIYGASKLANIFHASELNARMMREPDGLAGKLRAVSLHPGAIPTELGRHLGPAALLMKVLAPLAFKTIPEGAATQVYCAITDNIPGGEYYCDCNVGKRSTLARDAGAASALWALSEQLLASKGFA